jgi:hypothetical protein
MALTLASTSHAKHDLAGMPSTDTSDLAETLVCLSRQLLRSPSSSDTLESMTLGDANDINDLILFKYGCHRDLLLEQAVRERNLVRNATTVYLNFHQVGLLLLQTGLACLSVGQYAHDGAVFADTL